VTGGWTVHGLWPSRMDGDMGPEFCIPADHFDMEKIKPIIEELLHHWPNLIPQQALFSLWQHEWLKHGTCAEQLPIIDGELNYFSTGLQLNERFSIRNILSQSGIEPSDTPQYKVSDILAAVEKARGKKAQAHCLKATIEGKAEWYLVDVRVCLDKDINQIDCPQHKPAVESELLELLGIPDVEQCPKDALLHYVVPRDDHYHDEDYHNDHKYAYNYREEFGDKMEHDHSAERDEL